MERREVDPEVEEAVVEAEVEEVKASDPVIEAVETLRERDAEPWSPGDLDGIEIRRGLARRRHHEQPRAG